MIPSIRLTDDEIASEIMRPDTYLISKQLFLNSGVLLIENAFPEEYIGRLNDLINEDYGEALAADEISEALIVGDRRLMIPLELKGALNDVTLYANPFVLPLISEVLGSSCTLGSLGSVISLPGAADQHFHRDHPFLFQDEQIDISMPPFAVNMLVPLIGLNESFGTTRIWPGSHHVWSYEEAEAMPSFDPVAYPGACLLLDYRLMHGGTANVSDVHRPLLFGVYHRPWFKDYVNFRKFQGLRISAEELAAVPEYFQEWFEGFVTA